MTIDTLDTPPYSRNKLCNYGGYVLIPISHYREFQKDLILLDALVETGIDQWGKIGIALRKAKEEQEKAKLDELY